MPNSSTVLGALRPATSWFDMARVVPALIVARGNLLAAHRDRRGRSSSVSGKGSTPPYPWLGTCTPASGATPCKRCPTPSTARRIPPGSSGRAGVVAVNTSGRELALDVSIPPPTEGETRRHFGTTDVGVFPARVGGRSVVRWNYALTSAQAGSVAHGPRAGAGAGQGRRTHPDSAARRRAKE